MHCALRAIFLLAMSANVVAADPTFISQARTACVLQHFVGKWFDVVSVAPFSDTTYLEQTELAPCSASQVRAARGGHVDIRLIVTPRFSTPASAQLTLQPFQLPGCSGQRLQADLRYVQNWYQTIGGWHSIGRPTVLPNRAIFIPELLLHDDTLVKPLHDRQRNALKLTTANGETYVTPDRNGSNTPRRNVAAVEFPLHDAAEISVMHIEDGAPRQLWISLTIPENAPAGEYAAQLELKVDENRIEVVPLALTVSPLTLNPTQKLYSLYYKGRLEATDQNWVTSDYKSSDQLLADLRNMKAHGIANPVIYQPIENTALMTRYMELRQQAELDSDDLFFMYLNTNVASISHGIAPLSVSLSRVRDIAEPFGVKNIYVYGEDEATASELQLQKRSWAALKSLGYNVFAAGSQFPAKTSTDALTVFNSARAPDAVRASLLQKNGVRMLSYGNPQGGVESPYLYRRNYGVALWAAEYDGAMLYAYQDSMGDGWNDFDHAFRDHNLTYPSADGPIDTIAWQGLASGIDDMRLLETVEALLRDNRDQSVQQIKARRAASYLLDTLKRQVRPFNVPGSPTRDFYLNYELLRKQLLDLGERLSPAPATGECS